MKTHKYDYTDFTQDDAGTKIQDLPLLYILYKFLSTKESDCANILWIMLDDKRSASIIWKAVKKEGRAEELASNLLDEQKDENIREIFLFNNAEQNSWTKIIDKEMSRWHKDFAIKKAESLDVKSYEKLVKYYEKVFASLSGRPWNDTHGYDSPQNPNGLTRKKWDECRPYFVDFLPVGSALKWPPKIRWWANQMLERACEEGDKLLIREIRDAMGPISVCEIGFAAKKLITFEKSRSIDRQITVISKDLRCSEDDVISGLHRIWAGKVWLNAVTENFWEFLYKKRGAFPTCSKSGMEMMYGEKMNDEMDYTSKDFDDLAFKEKLEMVGRLVVKGQSGDRSSAKNINVKWFSDDLWNEWVKENPKYEGALLKLMQEVPSSKVSNKRAL